MTASHRARVRVPTHNLPTPVTSFVGRQAELVQAAALLDASRLVTLTGAGGCGKTRLATELGFSVASRFPDGAWLADLSPLTDGGLVASVVAGSLGVAEVPGEPVVDVLIAHLAERHMLLLLDNCEHVVEACAELTERLLGACPYLSCLATSREPLGVDGEAHYRVPPLAIPAGSDDTDCASVELFRQRAHLARPALPWSAQQLSAVANICRHLDGMPLAIELVAARCRSLSVEQIARELSGGFSIASGRRTRAARHRSIEASMKWSWSLLSPNEELLLRRLSVFVGGFTLESVARVCGSGELDTGSITALVGDLVDRSLVQPPDGNGRHRLLEVIRQYARDKAAAAGEAEDLGRRHAEHFASVAESLGQGLFGAEMLECQRTLDAELDNLRAADDWAAEHTETEIGYRLHSSLRLFWPRRADEAAQRLRRVLALPGGEPLARARVLMTGSEVACHLGDLDDLDRLAKEGVGLTDDPAVSGEAHGILGWSRYFAADEDAASFFAQAIPLLREAGRIYALIDTLWGAGFVGLCAGRHAEARRSFDEALALAHDLDNPMAVGRSWLFAGIERMLDGEFDEAERMLGSAGLLLAENGDAFGSLWAEGALPFVSSARGEHADALTFSRLARREARRFRQHYALAWATWSRVVAEYRGGAPGDPLPGLTEAEGHIDLIGLSWARAWCTALRAERLVALGDLERARREAEEAVELATSTLYARRAEGRARLALARVNRAQGDGKAAWETAHQALGSLAAAGMPLETIEALELAGGLAADGGRPEALRILLAADAARRRLGYPVPPVEADGLQRDTGKARRLLDDAMVAEAEKGSRLSLAEAVTYARRSRGPRQRPTTGWGSLTPVELEVVALVARGLRNTDVADRLFVSPATVKSHLGRVFKKLDVTSRAELASLASRRL